MRRAAARFVVLWWIAAAVGCNRSGDGEQISIQGAVTYRGAVVPGGTVLFQPNAGKAKVAAIDQDGHYQTSLSAGTYQVGVVASTGIPEDVDPWQQNVKLPPPLVPEKFGRPETSETVVAVSPENTTIDISLQ